MEFVIDEISGGRFQLTQIIGGAVRESKGQFDTRAGAALHMVNVGQRYLSGEKKIEVIEAALKAYKGKKAVKITRTEIKPT